LILKPAVDDLPVAASRTEIEKVPTFLAVSIGRIKSRPSCWQRWGGTVPPRRKPNGELRTREYLTETEVERLIKAAKANRYGQRDATMILMAYRHGLRVAEVVDLRSGRSRPQRGAARPACQARPTERASAAGRRNAGAARIEAVINLAIRVHVRAGRTIHHSGLRQNGREGGS
jgi:hypothetical protein